MTPPLFLLPAELDVMLTGPVSDSNAPDFPECFAAARPGGDVVLQELLLEETWIPEPWRRLSCILGAGAEPDGAFWRHGCRRSHITSDPVPLRLLDLQEAAPPDQTQEIRSASLLLGGSPKISETGL